MLYSIWGSAKNDLFIVGSQGNLLHYDGKDWSNMGFYTTMHLRRVWGTAGDNVYAVGDSGTVMHYDGSKWSPPLNSNTTNDLYGIWGNSENNIFAVGSFGTIIHYGALTPQPSPSPSPAQGSTPSPGPTPEQSSPPASTPAPTGVNWMLIGGAIGAIAVVGAVAGFTMSRRQRKKESK
jgi:hypothetical protein